MKLHISSDSIPWAAAAIIIPMHQCIPVSKLQNQEQLLRVGEHSKHSFSLVLMQLLVLHQAFLLLGGWHFPCRVLKFEKIASLPRPRRFSLRSSSCCCMSCSFSTTCTNRETWSSRADAWTLKTHPKRPSKLDQAGPVRYHQLHLAFVLRSYWRCCILKIQTMTIMTRTTIRIM